MYIKKSQIYLLPFIALSLLVVILAIGLRPQEVGTDTVGYIYYFKKLAHDSARYFQYDYLFEIWCRALGFIDTSSEFIFSSLAFVNIAVMLMVSNKINDLFEQKLGFYRLLFLIFTFLYCSPFFFSIQVNVLRQGVSTIILFLYFTLMIRRGSLVNIVLLAIIAQGFHHSALFFLILSPLVYLKYNNILALSLGMSVFYSLGIGQYFLKLISVPLYNKIINYGAFSGYTIGLRHEFTLLTVIVGLLFHYMTHYLLHGLDRFRFLQLLKVYWICCLPFFSIGFGTYSDRYLLPSWILISILSATFLTISLKNSKLSIYWYLFPFISSTFYFILKTQGIIG